MESPGRVSLLQSLEIIISRAAEKVNKNPDCRLLIFSNDVVMRFNQAYIDVQTTMASIPW